MKGLLSLLITSCMNERSEINPFGDISVFDDRFSKNAIITSPRPLPFGPESKSVLVWSGNDSMCFCWILLSRFNG